MAHRTPNPPNPLPPGPETNGFPLLHTGTSECAAVGSTERKWEVVSVRGGSVVLESGWLEVFRFTKSYK